MEHGGKTPVKCRPIRPLWSCWETVQVSPQKSQWRPHPGHAFPHCVTQYGANRLALLDRWAVKCSQNRMEVHMASQAGYDKRSLSLLKVRHDHSDGRFTTMYPRSSRTIAAPFRAVALLARAPAPAWASLADSPGCSASGGRDRSRGHAHCGRPLNVEIMTIKRRGIWRSFPRCSTTVVRGRRWRTWASPGAHDLKAYLVVERPALRGGHERHAAALSHHAPGGGCDGFPHAASPKIGMDDHHAQIGHVRCIRHDGCTGYQGPLSRFVAKQSANSQKHANFCSIIIPPYRRRQSN